VAAATIATTAAAVHSREEDAKPALLALRGVLAAQPRYRKYLRLTAT
jgi:hypothetical protein